jgi:hypothetical protein
MLELLGQEIAKELDSVKFIGVQKGFGYIPDQCLFNCLKTKTTFLTNSLSEAYKKLELIRKSFKIS